MLIKISTTLHVNQGKSLCIKETMSDPRDFGGFHDEITFDVISRELINRF